MNRQKTLILVVFLALVTTMGALLQHIGTHQRLGQPGVRTEPIPGSQNVNIPLPTRVPGYAVILTNEPPIVVNALPPDTSFGRAIVTAPDHFESQINVVLMGTDRSSIHKPQECLTGQGWVIDDAASRVEYLPMTRPFAYQLPVMRLVATLNTVIEGQHVTYRGVYVYWFVDENSLTAQHAERMWWTARDMLATGVLDRFAYISYFAVCLPGQEDAAFERLKQLMVESVPLFQLVPRTPSALAAGAR
jgi:hypothetical protein